MITLNILVLDDKLTPALKAIQMGMELLLEKRVKMPGFDIGHTGVLEVDPMFDLPAVGLRFVANRTTDSSHEVLDQIEKGSFDSYAWDAVIIDNNWGNKETDDGGCRHILPACLQRPHFQATEPHYMLFTWHFKENPYLRNVMQSLTPYQNVAPIHKDDHSAVAEWFRKMLGARVRRQISPKERTTSGKSLSRFTPNLVAVEADGTLRINGEPVPFVESWQKCLLFLFYLGKFNVPVKQTKDVINANDWFRERMSKPEAGNTQFGLEARIVSALEKIKSFNQSLLFENPKGLDVVAGKTWNAFRGKYELIETSKKGGPGNTPEVILKSIVFERFDLPLTKLPRI